MAGQSSSLLSRDEMAELLGMVGRCTVNMSLEDEKDDQDTLLGDPKVFELHRGDTHFYAHSVTKIDCVPYRVQNHYKHAAPNPFKRELYVRDTAKKSRRVFFFEGKVNQIHSIQLSEETFEASVHFYLTWLASDEDLQSYYSYMNLDDDQRPEIWVPSSAPTVLMDNAQSDDMEILRSSMVFLTRYSWMEDWAKANGSYSIESAFGFDPRFGIFVRVQYQFRGALLEEFEMQSYPFDCQDLKMYIKLKEPNGCIVPIPSNFVSYDPSKSTLADFRVRGICGEFGTSSAGSSRSQAQYPRATLVIKMQREWTSNLDVLLSIGILAGLTLVVFVMEPSPSTDIGNRVNYLMTLILTDVALQQSVNDKLDDFEYLTTVNKYILSAFFFKVIVLIWVCVPFYPIYDAQIFADEVRTDVIATWVFVIAYVVFIAFWLISFFVVRHLEEMKLYKSSTELDHEFQMEAHEAFSINLAPSAFAKLDQTAPLRKYKRLVQYGHTDEPINDGSVINRELKVFPPNRDVKSTNALRMTVSMPVIVAGVIGCFTATLVFLLVMRHYPRALWVQICIQTVVIYASCVIVGAFSRWERGFQRAQSGVTSDDDEDYEDDENIGPRTKYDHDLGIDVAFIMQGVVSIVMSPLRKNSASESRGISMHVLVIVWYTIRLVGDGMLLRRYRDVKHRLVGKYTVIIGKKKWFSMAILQGFRVFVTALPLFVVQSATSRDHFKPFSRVQGLDVIGLLICAVSFVVVGLCYRFGDSQWVWNRTSVESIPRHSDVPCCGAPAQGQLQMYGRLQEPEVSSATDQFESKGVMLSSKLSWSMNPFEYVRYPLHSGEILLWFGFWVVSIQVYKYEVIGLVSMLSPICLFFFHVLLSIPLLEVFADHEFGEKGDYQDWKFSTGTLFPGW